MNKYIQIEGLKSLLGLSDKRAIRDWCRNNKVELIRQGKMEFVFETEFELAYDQPFINKLKRKFPDTWNKVYQMHKTGDLGNLLMQVNHASTNFPTIYNRKSDTKDKYLSKLKNYEKKKTSI